MMPCERKSVEPMAAITAPKRTAAQHQSLLHFIGEGRWSDEKVLTKVREGAAGAGTPRADRSVDHRRHELSQERAAFGRGSSTIVRRAWQAGQLSGRGDVVDRQSRCELAGGLSDEISFKTKPEIALAQIRWACEAGLPRGAVLMDAGYGVDTDLRTSRAG